MARLAHRLPVLYIPEQPWIATVRFDVVNYLSRPATPAKGMIGPEQLRRFAPPAFSIKVRPFFLVFFYRVVGRRFGPLMFRREVWHVISQR